jgi:hypothetical protein
MANSATSSEPPPIHCVVWRTRNGTRGGTSDTDVNELAKRPNGAPSAVTVIGQR